MSEISEKLAEGAGGGKLAAILGEDFSFTQAIGGFRGAVESVAPGGIFVLVYLIWGGLTAPLMAAAGVALALAVVRLAQRTPLTQVITGLIGVAFGFWWAKTSGRAEDYYAPALLINVGYMVGCLASLVARWPIVGLVVGMVRMDLTGWRSEPELVRRARAGTWLLVGMFALRLAVKTPLYFQSKVAWLGIAHIVMGIPLYALTLWCVWLLVRGRVMPADPPETAEASVEASAEASAAAGLQAEGASESPLEGA
ncbi:MAG: DUF3159 domain-containing protein [Micrococcales bacterium]|nr:DUF3159 domain-containing protein [Micrococcales bacterium]